MKRPVLNFIEHNCVNVLRRMKCDAIKSKRSLILTRTNITFTKWGSRFDLSGQGQKHLANAYWHSNEYFWFLIRCLSSWTTIRFSKSAFPHRVTKARALGVMGPTVQIKHFRCMLHGFCLRLDWLS